MKLKHITVAAAAAIAAISCSTTPKEKWAPAGDHIITIWGENLDPAEVLAEYVLVYIPFELSEEIETLFNAWGLFDEP